MLGESCPLLVSDFSVNALLLWRDNMPSSFSSSYSHFRNNWSQDGWTGGDDQLITTSTMEHSNLGEINGLVSIFNRARRSGLPCTLHLDTVEGLVRANLHLRVGPPGAPVAREGSRHQHPHHPHYRHPSHHRPPPLITRQLQLPQ